MKFTYLLLGLFLLNCSPNQTDNPNPPVSPLVVSESYKEPKFLDDDRTDQILGVAPQIHRLIANYTETEHIPGIAYGIVVDDEMVVSNATGFIHLEKEIPATTTSSFRIASMTKSFTAMAIMKLRDEGKLSLSDPASKYIPEMASITYLTSDSPIIDIENLLTMTAGFPEDNPWGDRQLDESHQMLLDLMTDSVSFSNPPSYQYEYSNTGYALLGNIVTRVTGMPYQQYITQKILQPLGMGETYWEIDSVPAEKLAIGYRWEHNQWKLEPMLHDGSFGSMGGLITSIEDFSKYVSYQLSAWPPRSEEDTGPVKRSSLREMQSAQFPRLRANAKSFNGEPCPIVTGYGYGLRISEFCDGLKEVGHGGALPGFGSNYRYYPELGIGIMAFCNLTYTSPYPFGDIARLLFDSLDLKPRQLPVSDVLAARQEQLMEWIQKQDSNLEDQILAENFFLDQSREDRIAHLQQVLSQAGSIKSIGKINPRNQLRGSFTIEAEYGNIDVFFTLTPEKYPKVQRLDLLSRGKEAPYYDLK